MLAAATSLAYRQTLNLAVGVPDTDLDPGQAATWPAQRRLPAELVRQVLLSTDLQPDPRGLRLRGASLPGLLDLQAANVPCRLSSGQLGLQGAILTNPDGNALNLDSARIDGGAILGQLAATGTVRAAGAHITGQLGRSRC